MTDDSLLPCDLPADSRKQGTSDFKSGLASSHIGPVLLREVERGLGLVEALAG